MDLKALVESLRETARLDKRVEAFRTKYGFPNESATVALQEQ
jgi:hypothetical protein